MNSAAVKAVAIGLVLVAVWFAIWSYGHQQYAAGVKAQKDAQASATLAEAARHDAEKQNIEHEAQKRIDAARADAIGAATATERLQQQIATIRNQLRDHASANGISTPAGTTSDMLAVVLSESIERNRALAEYADRASTAGRICEKQYDTVRGRQQ